MAEYYAFLTSARMGLLDEETFLGLVSERYGAYLTALGSGDSLVSAAATKNTAATSYDLIYNGGVMASLLFDIETREAANGEKSLDDIVRAIHAEYANAKTPLTLKALRNLIRQETGVDFHHVIRRNIRRTEALDLAKALAAFGLVAEITMNEDGARVAVSRTPSPSSAQEALYRAWLSGG